MIQNELLRVVTGVLDHLAIRYFVTGSTATILFGEPRFTNDIDIVIQLKLNQVKPLVGAFSSDKYYVSEDAACEAVTRGGQFNLIEPATASKVDFIILSNSVFDRSRLSRIRRVLSEPDLEINMASPEDVILMKMKYYEEGGSEKHLRDIAGVIRICGNQLDYEYIEGWSKSLSVDPVWQLIRQQTGIKSKE